MYYLSRTNTEGLEFWLSTNGHWVSKNAALSNDIDIKGWKSHAWALRAARSICAKSGGLYRPEIKST